MPGIQTPYSGRGIDLTVVRENVEDLYAGIEHMQTEGVAQCLKLMSRKGCEKIVRLAFEVAKAEGRKSIHCATKANIMKLTEGLLKRTFEEIAKEYPDIDAQHIIVDNCAHQLVRAPEQFEVIVTSNMNGDILSDLTSGLIGGLGFAPGANIGSEVSIFEAVHGSAPKHAGKNTANPTAVILSAVMMLRHLGKLDIAALVENSVLATLEADQTRTSNGQVTGRVTLGTREFAEAVISNLGKQPVAAPPAREHRPLKMPVFNFDSSAKASERRLVGADVFVEFPGSPEELGQFMSSIGKQTNFALKMISNRGTKVYPDNGAMTDNVDHWRCRFVLQKGVEKTEEQNVIQLLNEVSAKHRWVHVEKLWEFDGKPSYTKAQGED